MYLDFTLKPNSPVFTQSIPDGWNAFAYVLNGQGEFGSKKTPVEAHHVLILSKTGDGFDFRNTSAKEDCRFVLIAGQPINEPVVQHGPFVMNTQDGKARIAVWKALLFSVPLEIQQAMQDFHRCENGFEHARQWQSKGIERSMVRH
jgi:quercetin 2,3-dioxygenase